MTHVQARYRRHISVLVMLWFALWVQMAAAQSFKDGTAGPTGVSGHRSESQQLLNASPLGLTGLAWHEARDNPCGFRLLTKDLQKGRDVGFGEAFTGFDCPKPLPGGLPPFPWGEDVNFSGNPRYYVRGVAVCNNKKSNKRMKGLRIYPAKVSPNKAQIVELGKAASDEHKHTNCSDWDDPVFCPDGKVAFGVIVHYTHKGITGLALRCKEVQW